MSKPLPHAEVIKHMADHGFESVECFSFVLNAWIPATVDTNPASIKRLDWRIKPVVTPLHIDDFPMPETRAPHRGTTYYVTLYQRNRGPIMWLNEADDYDFLACGRVYLDKAKRDKANELLIVTLRNEK